MIRLVAPQLFSAIVYVTPVLGAYIADVYAGRYLTILGFCVVYIIGLLLTTASAWPTAGYNATDGQEHSAPFYIDDGVAQGLSFAGLFVCVSLGAGGIKSNVVVLGADQFVLPQQAAQQAAFFNCKASCEVQPRHQRPAVAAGPSPGRLECQPQPRRLGGRVAPRPVPPVPLEHRSRHFSVAGVTGRYWPLQGSTGASTSVRRRPTSS